MKTDTVLDHPDSFETRLRSGLDHIAAVDPIDEPGPFDPDAMRIGIAEQQPRRSLAPMLAAAAAVVAVTVGGLAFFASRTSAPTVADQPTVAVTEPVTQPSPASSSAQAPLDTSQPEAEASLDAAVVAILHTVEQRSSADALAEALRAQGVSVEHIAEATRSFEQTMLMPVTGESNAASLALDDLISIGGFDTWSADLAAAPLPANVTDVILLGRDGRPTLPLTPTGS